jgi:hypothetical protein
LGGLLLQQWTSPLHPRQSVCKKGKTMSTLREKQYPVFQGLQSIG